MDNNIDFTNYERITDSLMYLSEDLTLNFVVSLSRKSKTGERLFFHKDIEYGSDRYGQPLRSIKRLMTFYFVIDDKTSFIDGFVIRPQDAELLIMLIESRILPWYFGDNNQVAFHIIDNNLVLKEFEPIIYTQSESKYLIFEPVIYSYNDTDSRGIKITTQSGSSAIMSIDKFMGFLHILRSDMYAIAVSLTNYVKSEPYGVNTISMIGLGSGGPNKNDGFNNIKPNNTNGFASNSFLDSVRKKGKDK